MRPEGGASSPGPTLLAPGIAVLTAVGLGAAATSAGADQVVVLVALLPMALAFCLRSPRGTILALTVWLAALGTTRRLFPQIDSASSTLGDSLLLVGPIMFVLLFAVSTGHGALRSRTPLSGPVYWFTALAAVELLNPLGGSPGADFVGGVFIVTPILVFWAGRAVLDRRTLRRLLVLLSWLAVGAAIYGLVQTYAGFPSWDVRWINAKLLIGYNSLNVGQTIRPFASFSSAQEYAVFLAIGVAVWFARGRTPATTVLSLCAIGLVGTALFLESSRGALLLAVIGIGVMVAARAGVNLLGASAGAVIAVLALGIVAGHVGGATSGTAAGATNSLLGHQLSGLANPLNAQSSTLGSHLSRLVRGLEEAFTLPIGHGTGSVSVGAAALGSSSLGTELDPSNAAVALGLPGLVLYLLILGRGLAAAFRLAASRRDWLTTAVLGLLVATTLQWLNSGLYATPWLAWLCLGWVDAESTREERAVTGLLFADPIDHGAR